MSEANDYQNYRLAAEGARDAAPVRRGTVNLWSGALGDQFLSLQTAVWRGIVQGYCARQGKYYFDSRDIERDHKARRELFAALANEENQ